MHSPSYKDADCCSGKKEANDSLIVAAQTTQIIESDCRDNAGCTYLLGMPGGFHFPSIFQLRVVANLLSAARSIAFRVLLRASQASDVSSIPIARSRFLRSGPET
jgi:hypothetical protein